MKIVLKPSARRDLRSITLFTGERWGVSQQSSYLEAINQAFATLSANPQTGRVREDVGPGLRTYRVRKHVVYYRVDADTVTIIRILHANMDAARHVG